MDEKDTVAAGRVSLRVWVVDLAVGLEDCEAMVLRTERSARRRGGMCGWFWGCCGDEVGRVLLGTVVGV